MRSMVVVGLCLAACGSRIGAIAADLVVEPSTLVFAQTATGDTRTATVTLQNASRAPLDLHLASAPPFAVAFDLHLSAGESRTVEVPFSPVSEGSAAGVLEVDGDMHAAVTLRGEGVAATQCIAADPCRAVHRDPATNRCVEENAADGAPCASPNACLVEGVCVGGACVGAARSCDDHDACTVDACEPGGGCHHFATVCPEPEDKCHIARCDPQTGCASEPAPDGTACGPADCTTAHVCMAGACRALPVPDGAPCGESSVCRAKGRCSAGTCNQPPATALPLAWSYPMPFGGYDFRGVVDSSGNLYWVECSPIAVSTPCLLVSHTPSGVRRFAASIPAVPSIAGGSHFAAGGRVFVLGPDASVAVFSEAGALLWSRASHSGRELLGAVAERTGWLWLLERTEGETDTWALLRFESDGTVAVVRALGGPPHGLVLDTSGHVYFAVSDAHYGQMLPGAAATIHLVSLSPTGAQRFMAPLASLDAPQAVFNGELLMKSGEVRSTVDGAVTSSSARSDDWSTSSLTPLMSAAGLYRWTGNGCNDNVVCDTLVQPLSLEGWPKGSSIPRFTWGRFLGDAVSQPKLLSDGSALFSSAAAHDVYLRALDAAGHEKLSCLLGSSLVGAVPLRSWRDATALTQGRWAVLEHTLCTTCLHQPPPVLRVYSVPGLELAPTGWAGLGGSPGSNGQPR